MGSLHTVVIVYCWDLGLVSLFCCDLRHMAFEELLNLPWFHYKAVVVLFS